MQIPRDQWPVWQLVLAASIKLTKEGITPFTRQDILRLLRQAKPGMNQNSVNPIIQGATRNLKGGVPCTYGTFLMLVRRGEFVLTNPKANADSKWNPQVSRVRIQPIWKLIEEAAIFLTKTGYTPFTRGDILRVIETVRPGTNPGSVNPIIQGMTCNLKGGVPSTCGLRLRSVARGSFELIRNPEEFLALAVA